MAMTKHTPAIKYFRCAGLFAFITIIYVFHVQLMNYMELFKLYIPDEGDQIQTLKNEKYSAENEHTETEQLNEKKPNGKEQQQRKNVLFIIVDDLRPQLGAYYDPENPDYFSKLRIKTPNLDKLASRSIVFTRAYAQYSLCGPSRTSLLTSRRPDTTLVYDNTNYWRDVGGNFTTLPQHFKNNGYTTLGFGKVFHPQLSSNHDDPPSWTEPYYRPPYNDRHFMPENTVAGWNAVNETEISEVPLMDINIANKARSALREIAYSSKRPFFMGIGFNKPHVHIVCPEKYFDLYPLEDEDSFLPNRSWQKPIIRPYGNFDGVKIEDGERIMPAEVLRRFRRAYFACISYVDDLVGEVLSEMDELGLSNNTIVSFMADHGFHLGENRAFAKITTWEMANRVPMMIRIPGVTDSGMITSSVVESLDMFPTLVEAAGLDSVPACPRNSSHVKLCTQGTSLLPLFGGSDVVVKDAAYSQILHHFGNQYTIRTKDYRLVDLASIRKVKLENGKSKRMAKWSADTSYTQLYDHTKDVWEATNLVDDPKYRDVVIELRNRLHTFVARQL